MSAIESHVAFILDDLAKKAVAEIIKLFDNTFAAFIEELNKKQNDIDQLKKKLYSSQVHEDTAEKTLQEQLSLSRQGESLVNHQTIIENFNFEQHFRCSTEVTQWDFPDGQQYIFEGINDGGETHTFEELGEDTAAAHSEGPVDCTRPESDGGEFGVLEFEIKADEPDRLNEGESSMLVPSQSQTSDVQHKISSVQGKRKVGRPKSTNTAMAETTRTTTPGQEAEEIPAKKQKRRRRKKIKATLSNICSMCNKSFSRPADLTKHRFTHKQKDLLSCSWCGATFPFMSQMMNHIRIHTGERPFCCHVCGRTFISNSQLKGHLWTHKSKELGSCSLCGADSSESLEDDTSRRRSTRLVPCARCGKTKSVI
ncbi:hypothetical protein ACEWY4_007343 [Coilia grayii]|uniref:C2H2-type domain-containing protein n=1 Tax=Coilia grayii TaxID=363190 RepID=A0ABD1KGH8_9TELE